MQTVNRLHALLAELLPGQAKKDITAPQAKAMLASVRPRDVAGKTCRRIAAEELAELVAVDAKIKKSTAELKAMVLARGSYADGPARCRPGGRRPGPGRRRRRRPVRRPQQVRVLDRHRTPGRVLRGAQPAPALPGREPAGQPRHPHRRDHPDPPGHRRAGLLPAQARRGQEAPRSDQVPQAQDLRRHLSPARHRRRSRPGRAARRRVREGTAGRLMYPARPAHTRTPALRISHFPDPHQRRYARRTRPGRPTSKRPVDNRREPM